MLLGTSTSAPYGFTWTNVPAGTYILKAIVTDAGSGIVGISVPITITVLGGSTPTPPPSTCKVSYQPSQWSGGFQANISITNTGTTTINGWVLKFTFPGDQQITNLWNGQYTQSGAQATITNLSWNGTIAPQGSIGLGFNGSWTTNNTSPTSFTLNGQVCN
jgi:cellulase/cellobiase CelA1